jgi:hypothetical protein
VNGQEKGIHFILLGGKIRNNEEIVIRGSYSVKLVIRLLEEVISGFLSMPIINPHPFFPSPNHGGGKEAKKLGFALAFSLGSPSFSVRITIGIY